MSKKPVYKFGPDSFLTVEQQKRKRLFYRFSLLAVVLIIFGWWAIDAAIKDAEYNYIVTNGVATNGKPVEIEKVKGGRRSLSSYYYVYEYKVNEKSYKIRSLHGKTAVSGLMFAPDKTIYYIETDPARATVIE